MIDLDLPLTEEDRLRRELARGQAAALLLESELVQEFFDEQRSILMEALNNANVRIDTLEEVHKTWLAVNRLQMALTSIRTTGQLARLTLESTPS